jgi:hypothetical protein
MPITYLIVTEYPCGFVKTETKKGTAELERYTDDRILGIYTKANKIAKVYPDGRARILKGVW